MTLSDFLNEEPGGSGDPFDMPFSNYRDVFAPMVGENIRNLADGFALHRLGLEPGNVALMKGATLVGFYHGTVLVIDEAARGKRLSVHLILEAVKDRPAPEPRKLSAAGRAALTAAWRAAQAPEQTIN